jgi:hypothetical protein
MYRGLPLQTALILEIVLPYPFLLAGAWLLLRGWCHPAAALFGAVLWTFCGFMMSHSVHVNMVAVLSHLPWLLWAFQSAGMAESSPQRWASVGGDQSVDGIATITGLSTRGLVLAASGDSLGADSDVCPKGCLDPCG